MQRLCRILRKISLWGVMEVNFLVSFLDVLSYTGYIVLAILVLLVMITVHEFGHYIAGKIFKFKIEEFAIGFGPKLFSKQKSDGEIFSVRLLPLGGFCAFKGEDDDVEDKDAFNNKKPWQRIIVLLSGAIMNYLLALILILTMFSFYGQPSLMTGKIDKAEQYEAEYSFSDRDIILKANGKNVYLITDLMKATENKKVGEIIQFEVLREGKSQTINVKLRASTNYENVEDSVLLYKALGVHYELDSDGKLYSGGMYSTFVKLNFFATIGRSIMYSFRLAGSVFMVLGELLTGALGIRAIGGTITTLGVTATAIKIGGFRYLLNIASLIGVNLAVFNLLPIPALDGSRVVFTAIEWARKKPINRRAEGIIHTIGFILILLFAIFVDLQRCF